MHKVFLSMLLCVIIFPACVDDPHEKGLVIDTPVIKTPERDEQQTGRGFAYISMNVDGEPAAHVQEILDALKKFEVDHPKHRISNWAIEKQQEAHSTPSHIYGIWITYDVEIQR